MTAHELADALAALVPAVVRTDVVDIDPRAVDELRAEEQAAVASAVPSRRAEFATGRRLLRALTGTSAAIGVAPDRAPLLPPGWVGSLAHDERHVIAAVGPAGTVRSLGVDLEAAQELDDQTRSIVVRHDDPDLDGCAALVLKEAAYKAWSGLGGGLIDFSDVRLELDDDRFSAAVLGTPTVLQGRWTLIADTWLAAVVVPPEGGGLD